jgi:hypothetical protein
MHRIMSARPLPGYRLDLRFDDGVEGEVDLGHLVGKGVFASWQDPAEFAKVSIDPESRTVTWPGEIDLCPESLYEDIIAAVAPCWSATSPGPANDRRRHLRQIPPARPE